MSCNCPIVLLNLYTILLLPKHCNDFLVINLLLSFLPCHIFVCNYFSILFYSTTDLNLNAQGQVSSSTVSQDQYESLAEGANFASPSHRLLSDCSSGENGDTQENPKTPSETNDCNEVSSSTGRSLRLKFC